MFYRIANNELLDYANWEYAEDCKYIENLTVNEYEQNKLAYIIKLDILAPNPNYKKDKAKVEREQIMRLSMTKLDFVNALEAFGITYTQVKELLASSEEAQKQWDLCERVYRFNPLLDEYCSTFNITSEQLDQLFINVQQDQNLL